MSLFHQDQSVERTPVSLITGYLGSGKTTLLNRLLRHADMADSAVIINEFGEVGLDHLLVEAIEGEVAVIASGCVCCTMRSDLEETLRGLLARRDSGAVPPFRRVLVETTGLADPAPIVQLLLNNPLLSRFVRLDTIATTVDAVHGDAQLDAAPEALKQAAIADRLLMTKTDLVQADAAAGLRDRLARLNPGARLHTVLQGDIAPEALFGAGLFDPARKTPDVQAWINEEAYHHGLGEHGHAHPAHAHGAQIHAFCLAFEEPLDWLAFASWMARLRRWHGENLLRIKGILFLDGEEAPVAIHGVHHVFHPPVQLRHLPDGDRRSRVVFIMRDLDRAAIEGSLRSFLREGAPA
jgi:G3E family GTPase